MLEQADTTIDGILLQDLNLTNGSDERVAVWVFGYRRHILHGVVTRTVGVSERKGHGITRRSAFILCFWRDEFVIVIVRHYAS